MTLGADILPDLAQLHTLKIVQEITCVAASRSLTSLSQLPQNHHNGFAAAPVIFAFEELNADSPGPAPQNPPAGAVLEEGDLRDYLIGWNRYCKNLRCVQLNKDVLWERRFEGDRWAERFQ